MLLVETSGLRSSAGKLPASKHGVVCDVCEGLDGPASRRHPAMLAVDADPATWWQSPTLAAGEEFRHVELIATLPDVSTRG
ncbi:unnamed protein product [Leptidea sinapis]|uniref:Laminin N-terminal domain-containing protein n=1 Tax=Leptidea sinapis TaxID=189913 RepID=A0A5E4R6J7_9NEOP|nr:unnamed protein product [Leptidea sinapis]